MRRLSRIRALGATSLAATLALAACSGTSGESTTTSETTGQATETVTVASFNFPESVVLAEIYAQALEAEGYTVERRLNLGSRELIFPDIEAGNIDLIPEYVGSALQVGFSLPAPATTEEGVEALRAAFADLGMTVLEAAPGEDKNVFVVTRELAEEAGLSSLEDLAGAGDLVLAGAPECEDRPTCYRGLVETYGLTNLSFEAIQEGAARVAALESGEADVILLFSTQPVISERGFVVLDEPRGIIAPENVVPVVRTSIIEANEGMAELLDSISALITTDVLLDLNGRIELDAEDPADVAGDWLVENGILAS